MWTEPFFLRAMAAGLGLALIAGPLGCFIVWRRMAYFGDTLAHSSLLGVALGLLAGIDLTLGVIACAVVLALSLVALQSRRMLASDTLLGILSHSALAFGLIAASLLTTVRFDLMSYLFGDILAVTREDIAWIYGGGALALALLATLWRPLLALTVHDELARAEGVPDAPVRLGFMLLIAFVIAIAMKIVGILLITAMLIIPAAAARRFARTPEAMAAIAAVIGMIAVLGGLAMSADFDTPSGPSIVAAAAVLCLIALLVPKRAPRTGRL
ncbi:zinc ABC transporter permease subunit ZnuB [Kaustia mangrovi]|uniref:High-affinity zinc uptake system membrane protein ZnuB n=1 Tax=Kaustia mangrovi TaxID=2593653 RepID=A0A7S8HBY3_9HYPH|nr:zinc ABC transporter permease subunit ZnuB [Kaustia mangrovi]QPC43167.1 zinc ABC transporter permease subunit ZnuB [Kaustia mangrovi]